MFPVMQLGGLSIQTSGLILLAGLWVALSVVERYAPRLGADTEEISNLSFYSLIGAILGARLVYVLRFPATFSEHPVNVFSLNPGLLDPAGALVAALLVALIYGQRRQLDLLTTLDALMPGFAVLALTLSLSQLASGSSFGLPSELPWAIELWGASRHPTQIYSVLAFAGLLWLLVSRLIPAKRHKGSLFLMVAALSAIIRIFVDGLRGDEVALLFGLRSTQMAAWLVLAACLWLLLRMQPRSEEKA